MRFDVTLSGEDQMVAIDFTMMTTNGAIVLNLDETDFQPLRVGNNVLTWEGRRGEERLPGGLYIYQLVVETAGASATQRGKIVLIR
jgi:hypothetical protein